MERINNICWVIIFMILSFALGYVCGNNAIQTQNTINDTTYNTTVLDSIKYNIQEKDSVIYKLKIKYYDEVKTANSLSDSDAVKLFKELVAD